MRSKTIGVCVMLSTVVPFLVPVPAPAQEAPEAKKVRWALGAGVLVAPRPYPEASAEVMPIPLLEVQAGRFYLQGIRAGYRFVDGDRLDVDVRARIDFSGLDPDDSPFLDGMEERDGTVEAGFGLDWSLSRHWVLGIGMFADVLGRNDGLQGAVDLGWRKAFARGRLVVNPSLGVVWQDDDVVDYYFGVRPSEARPGRPAWRGDTAATPRASIFSMYRLGERWRVTGFVSADFFTDDITDSPIVDQSAQVLALVGVGRSF